MGVCCGGKCHEGDRSCVSSMQFKQCCVSKTAFIAAQTALSCTDETQKALRPSAILRNSGNARFEERDFTFRVVAAGEFKGDTAWHIFNQPLTKWNARPLNTGESFNIPRFARNSEELPPLSYALGPLLFGKPQDVGKTRLRLFHGPGTAGL